VTVPTPEERNIVRLVCPEVSDPTQPRKIANGVIELTVMEC
jgi:hypothetical protein